MIQIVIKYLVTNGADFNLSTNKRLILASQALIMFLDCKYYSPNIYPQLISEKTIEESLISLFTMLTQYVQQEKVRSFTSSLFASIVSGIKDSPLTSSNFFAGLFSCPMVVTTLNESMKLVDIDVIIINILKIFQDKLSSWDDKRKLFLVGNIIELVNNHMKKTMTLTSILNYMHIVSGILPSVSRETLGLDDTSMQDDNDVIPTAVKQQIEIIFKKSHLKRLIEAIVSTSDNFELFSQFSNLLIYLMPEDSKQASTVLNTISYTQDYAFIKTLWKIIQKDVLANMDNLALFSKVLDNILSFIDDEEFKTNPFNFEEYINISNALKPIAFELVWSSSTLPIVQDLTSLLTKLHLRDVRLKFCPKNHFIVEEASLIDVNEIASFIYSGDDMQEEETEEDLYSPGSYVPLNIRRIQALREAVTKKKTFNDSHSFRKTRTLISKLPYMVPLDIRLKIFKEVIHLDKEYCYNLQHFIEPIDVKREQLFEDSYSKLSSLSATQLKGRIRVQFVDKHGMVEAGIGEGVFREFLFELCKLAFSTGYGLFKATDEGRLYPNPNSALIYPDGLDLRFYHFLGKILGKAIYDSHVIDLPFAKFFISKLMKGNNDDLINDLFSFDKELYRNLIYLKNNENLDLGLNFTIVEGDELSEKVVKPLIPNGENILVNDKNKYSFIYRLANYKLNYQIKSQSEAFLKGLNEIISPKWMSLFDENELIDIISGSDQPIDIDDMYANTEYSGGYHQTHPTIQLFWDVVFNDLSSRQHVLLLKFISSISRPPLMGFKDLFPKICIQHVGDTSRLPTSSTCYNLLKLPAYMDRAVMKEKLVQALEQGTQSFGLT